MSKFNMVVKLKKGATGTLTELSNATKLEYTQVVVNDKKEGQYYTEVVEIVKGGELDISTTIDVDNEADSILIDEYTKVSGDREPIDVEISYPDFGKKITGQFIVTGPAYTGETSGSVAEISAKLQSVGELAVEDIA